MFDNDTILMYIQRVLTTTNTRNTGQREQKPNG